MLEPLNNANGPLGQNQAASGHLAAHSHEPHPKPLPNDRELLRMILDETKRFTEWADQYVDAHRLLEGVLLVDEKDGRIQLAPGRTAARVVDQYWDSRTRFVPSVDWIILDYITLSQKDLLLLRFWNKVLPMLPDHSEDETPINLQAFNVNAVMTRAVDCLSKHFHELHTRAFKKLASLDVSTLSEPAVQTPPQAFPSVRVDVPRLVLYVDDVGYPLRSEAVAVYANALVQARGHIVSFPQLQQEHECLKSKNQNRLLNELRAIPGVRKRLVAAPGAGVRLLSEGL